MDPTLALDWQRELVETMRSEVGKRYLSHFVTSARRQATRGDGNMSTILSEAAKLNAALVLSLSAAETFVVDEEMMDLVMYAADTLPDHTVQPWTFPTTHGFVLLPTSLVFDTDEHSMRTAVTVQAFLWAARNGGIDLFFFSNNDDLDLGSRRYLGHLSLCHVSRVKFGDSFDTMTMVDHRQRDEVIEHGSRDWSETMRMMMMTVAFGHLSQQTLTESVPAKVPRHALKRWNRSTEQIDHVTRIIRLRRRSGSPVGDGEREWHHRWVVRGHWRQQPCGPGRTQTRPVWIAAYVKGPEDAPLLVSDKINHLVR